MATIHHKHYTVVVVSIIANNNTKQSWDIILSPKKKEGNKLIITPYYIDKTFIAYMICNHHPPVCINAKPRFSLIERHHWMVDRQGRNTGENAMLRPRGFEIFVTAGDV